MREMEITTLPNIANIDAIQTEISWKHRKSLILWLIEVHSEYDLRPETLYLTINFIDRVCAKRVVKKSEYQLLGLTCLWIASKYEENHGRVPSPKTLALLLESSVPVSRFAAMERDILTDLDFVLGHPTPEAFLKSQCKQLNNVKPPVRALARLILELTLIHRRFRPFRPSLLAMASLILADSLHTCRFWTHGEPLLGRIIQNLEECLIQAPRQIIEKYRSGKFLNISLHVKTMLDNKAAFLYQARLNSTPQIAVDSHGGFMTPPKDSSPFRNPWDPEVTLVSSQPYLPNHIPAQHPHHVQLTPVFQSQQQYIHSQQPPPVPGFQLPVPHQYTHHQPYSQQQTLFRHNSFQHHAANFQMAERTYSEVSGRSAMDL
ncbi:hypothetical protein BCR33DRAFT_130817 [Rhizoclosmatium globosum]|uniref:Uncharacterized protein n=1 Tax=Rhizoclosmatium globosum TaxID=329046 RepID=A0A1Y2CI86_9FUNG|nr:hypothetical protein BCR33DRAFT_130817 [Rhizoclosmatium globosum]|eukprot:ORY46544.1 hypothetical protein BCR33DRAFT_130817 [Rhizoclosmatium globosum]